MKKYELTTNTKMWYGRKLYQIKALKDFGNVKAGDLGGYIEKEENLSQDGNAWVYDSALVYDNAWIYGNARVFGDVGVFGNACVYDNAWIYRDAQISNNADYIYFKGFGSENRNTTMFKTKNRDVYVSCGCFTGSLRAFMDKVKETHGNTKYAKEYLACIEVAKIHFEIDE